MTQEALKLALEFIENSECGTADLEARIKEALAQLEQDDGMCTACENNLCTAKQGCVALDTPPQRTWVGLTDEEVDECYYWKDCQWTTDELVRHVEAKLKEKNT